MSTIASLLSLMDPQIKSYNEQELTANRIQFGNTQNQTELVRLAELKRQQEQEEAERQFMREHPDAILQGGMPPQSILQGLGPAGGAMAGPMTQQTTIPGQPPGAPQVVPGGQDLSRFAGVSPQGGGPLPAGVGMPTVTPPQSTIAGLGPAGQPQPQMQAPQPNLQDRLRELMRTNPGAALAVQKQIQGQELNKLAMEEKRLDMGSKVMEHVGRVAQGVTDQAGLEAMKNTLIDQGLGKYAAQLPQTYSKEAMQPFIEKAVSVKDSLLLQIEDTKAQAARLKALRDQANIPNYTGDAQLDAIIYTKMKDQPTGTMPSREIVDAAIQQREANKLNVSERQGVQAAEIERTEKPLEGVAGKAVSDLTLLRTMTDDIRALRKDAYTGPWVGRTGYLREQAGQMDKEETAFRSTLQNMKDILGRLRSGANIPAPEMANLERLLPDAKDHPDVFQSKMQSFQRALEQQRESLLKVGTTGREQLRKETTPTTPRVGTQAQPTGQPGAKVVTRAALHAEAQRRNISPEKAEELAKAKGYTVQ